MEYLNTFNLNGKVALITGGGGILGQKFAQGLISAGASVAIVEINEKIAQDAVLAVGGNAAAFVCDVSDAESVKKCVLSSSTTDISIIVRALRSF